MTYHAKGNNFIWLIVYYSYFPVWPTRGKNDSITHCALFRHVRKDIAGKNVNGNDRVTFLKTEKKIKFWEESEFNTIISLSCYLCFYLNVHLLYAYPREENYMVEHLKQLQKFSQNSLMQPMSTIRLSTSVCIAYLCLFIKNYIDAFLFSIWDEVGNHVFNHAFD